MAEKTSWVKIDRNITKWGWYQDANTIRVFLHLILTANIKDQEYMGVTIGRGEVATSYPSLSRAVKISINSVRTAISHLKSTGEITVRKYPKFQVISIRNYAKYQDKPTAKGTGKPQSTHSQATGNPHQSKNIKNGRMEEYITARAREEWENALNVPEQFRGRFNNEHEWLEFIGEEDPCDMS